MSNNVKKKLRRSDDPHKIGNIQKNQCEYRAAPSKQRITTAYDKINHVIARRRSTFKYRNFVKERGGGEGECLSDPTRSSADDVLHKEYSSLVA